MEERVLKIDRAASHARRAALAQPFVNAVGALLDCDAMSALSVRSYSLVFRRAADGSARSAWAVCAAVSMALGCATPPPAVPTAAAQTAALPTPTRASTSDVAAGPSAAAPATSTALAAPQPAADLASSVATAAPTVVPADAAPAAPIIAEATNSDLWERLRRGFRVPDLDSPLVAAHERWYASRPDYVQRTVERAGPWLFHIVEELERRDMPTEVALIPFIESAFNPQAMSPAQASGMWQFIPGTGKVYGLTQSMFQDQRRDPLESTRAALDYFQKLYGMFGDWQLAFAAYNCGEGAVLRAIEKNRRKHKPTDYAHLVLPKETRNYVPKLQAVKNIVLDPGRYALTLPPIENERYFVTVTRTRDIDVAKAAEFAGLSVPEFLALNPSFNKPVIVGATDPQIVLPRDKADQFLANVEFAQGRLSSYTTYTVPERAKLELVAAKFDMSADDLRHLNNLPAGIVLKPGATLVVPSKDESAQDISPDVVAKGQLLYELERPMRRITLKARRGDTALRIAKRYGVSAEQVRDWNGLSGNHLAVGQRVVVYQPVRLTKGKVLHASHKHARGHVAHHGKGGVSTARR